jgi:hypothetical protein
MIPSFINNEEEIKYYHQYQLINKPKKEINKFYNSDIFHNSLMCPCALHVNLTLEILNNTDGEYNINGVKMDEKTYIKTKKREIINKVWRKYLFKNVLFNPNIY